MGFTLNQHEQEKQIKRLQQKEDHDTTDYESLENLPDINGVELKGNKSLSDLGIQGDSLEAAGGEILTLDPTSEGRALLHTAYGMSTQNGTPTPSSPVDIESAKADFRSVGKNLHDVSVQLPRTNVDTTATYNSDGTFTIDGTASMNGAQLNGIINGFSISDLKAGDKLVVSYEVISGSASHLSLSGDTAIYLYKTDGNIGGIAFPTTLSKGDKESVIIDVTNDLLTDGKLVYNGVQMWIRSGDVFNKLQLAIMIRRYGTDDTFEPYTKHDTTTDLTLRAIEVKSSDAYNLVRDNKYYIADTLDYSEDNGFVVTRRVGTDKFDGSESWTLPGDRASQYGYSFRLGNYDEVLTGIISKTGNIFDLVTDKFRCFSLIGGQYIYSNTSSADWGSGIYRTMANLWISMGAADMSAEGVTDLASFQTWLSNHNVNILYPITPITETITTAQALALLGLKTYDESTTISSQAEPSCTIAVEYAKERLGALALTAYDKAVADGLNIAAITPHILPDAPTTDGSYNLKVTVTSGEAAYSWEAVTP